MRIAIAGENNNLSSHFGHSPQFFIYEIENGNVKLIEQLTPPPHQPGVIPNWLSKQNIEVVIVGSIGDNAKKILEFKKIKVIEGVKIDAVENIARDFANDSLKFGEKTCHHEHDHNHKHDQNHHHNYNHKH
ncbi:MAG: NifB/NifX family molybdenum-iron cluster-binding protein [candidate division WOR-3 bacterium]